MPTATATYLAEHPVDARIAVGGAAAQADPAAQAIVGSDRYDTSTRVASRFFPHPGAVGAASGQSFPDGLAGGAALGIYGAPLVLTASSALPAAASGYLQANSASISGAVVFGGPITVSDGVAQQVGTAIAG